MPFKCDKCEKEFNTQQGLDQHRADKHGVSSHEKREQKKQAHQDVQKSANSSAKRKKTLRNVAIVAAVIAILAVVGWAAMNYSPGPPDSNNSIDILNTNLYSHTGVAMHIHPNLRIEINGEEQRIPANIGISGSAMRVIHTHDETGKLHVESPVPHTFVLKDFFTIWGKTFNSTCIFENCIDENHTLSFFVNSQPSSLYENLPLKDHDNIRIVYGTKVV